jgi:hypothetical protein
MKSGDKTIRILANGGLGNQLFIWNLAHNLENKYACKIQIIFPKSGSNRVCEIFRLVDFCSHQIKVIESNNLNHAFAFLDRIMRKSPFIAKIIAEIFSIMQTKLPSETLSHSRKSPRYIRGYFQSPALVEETIHLYKEELLLATKLTIENSEYSNLDIMKMKMLHIRRGDFIVNKATVGLLSMEYFSKMIKKGEKVTIFTDAKRDDTEVVDRFPNSIIFGSDSMDTWTSFSMLSHAGHLIASNSTFSWWAGLICLMRGGTVIAPNPWTRTNVYGENYLETKGFSVSPARFEEV